MKVLLDTNILIHRETSSPINSEIGTLFNWLDKLNYKKFVHPISLKEIQQYSDKIIVRAMEIKLKNYNILPTIAPLTPEIESFIQSNDKNQNDINNTLILNEVVEERVDFLITEDRKIIEKAFSFQVSERVFTIDSFLEKITVENPELVDYKVLSVKKEFFGNLNIDEVFFESFKSDYNDFEKWFNKKSNEKSYICKYKNSIIAFLYLKIEGHEENYSDIIPTFNKKKRLKIGTFKVTPNGFRLGERFIKIIFDNALQFKVDEIYVTIFEERIEQNMLIELLKEWGFVKWGIKKSISGTEIVLIRDFRPPLEIKNPKITYPYISKKGNIFLVPIYPAYHTNLFPDSILRTESPEKFIENEPFRNSISKVYISRSIERDINKGDLLIFYRTGGYYESVVTTIGIAEGKEENIKDEKEFIRKCRKRSVFTDEELKKHWDYKKSSRPFILSFLYISSFHKRLNLAKLIELKIIRDINSAPRGFTKITPEQFDIIVKEAKINESTIIN